MYVEASSPSWFDKLVSCCSPPSPRLPHEQHQQSSGRMRLTRRAEKDVVWSNEPTLTPPPSFAPRPVHLGGMSWTNGTGATSSLADAHRTQWPALEPPATAPASTRDDTRSQIRTQRKGLRSRHRHSRSGSSILASSSSRRSSHSVRRRLRTSSSLSRFPLPSALSASSSNSRNLQISAPTNFRHLHSDTFAFPSLPQEQQHQIQQYQHQQLQRERFQEEQMLFQQQYLQRYQSQYREQYQQFFQRRPPSFEPLDFTHLPSPLTSSFERATVGAANEDDSIFVTPRAHTRNGSTATFGDDSHSTNLASLDRSYSTMSFHLPRRLVAGGSIRGVSRGASQTASRGATPIANDMHGEAASAAPMIPQRSRLRSHSSPAVESMVERIASAMIEMERLQAEIDSVIERQSICISSRPSTAYGAAFDEVPVIPVVPAAAPSFAERLSTERPKTAPPRTSTFFDSPSTTVSGPSVSAPSMVEDAEQQQQRQQQRQQQQPQQLNNDLPRQQNAPLGSTVFAGSSTVSIASAASVASAAAKATRAKAKAAAAATAATGSNGSSSGSATGCLRGGGPRINGLPVDVPLAPPLPLVLRPPLRKKKSFSRVSHWLSFNNNSDGVSTISTAQGHDRGISSDLVTNAPRPVTKQDGFYQCIVSSTTGFEGAGRTSIDTLASTSTVETLSTWTTEKGEADRRQLVRDENDEENNNAESSIGDRRPRAGTPTPTSATTTITLATALTNMTATTTPTIPAVAGLPGSMPSVVATSTIAEKPAGILTSAHRPQSVGVAF